MKILTAPLFVMSAANLCQALLLLQRLLHHSPRRQMLLPQLVVKSAPHADRSIRQANLSAQIVEVCSVHLRSPQRLLLRQFHLPR